MQQVLFFLLAIFAGVMLPIQAGLNSEIGKAVKSPVYGTLISFLVGTLGLLLYMVLTRANWADIKGGFQLPWFYWIGGLLGAVYVAAIIILTPRLGVALTFGITVAAQMIFGVLMDHYGWLGVPEHPINWMRVIGVTMIIGGVALVRAY
ncbi:transporter family-2 protein [Neolewinella agarilytica]|uniref:Transporter family-2 protein n=1 Tax=Neolewinella agarilytica TaxID=478744 RepID=A0A1H9KZ05_9BACT|nr:transporter family-2 protein [Neolewinella agarilytica]